MMERIRRSHHQPAAPSAFFCNTFSQMLAMLSQIPLWRVSERPAAAPVAGLGTRLLHSCGAWAPVAPAPSWHIHLLGSETLRPAPVRRGVGRAGPLRLALRRAARDGPACAGAPIAPIATTRHPHGRGRRSIPPFCASSGAACPEPRPSLRCHACVITCAHGAMHRTQAVSSLAGCAARAFRLHTMCPIL